jgi:hypothetical protein
MNKLVENIADELSIWKEGVTPIIKQLDGRHGWKLVPVEPTEKMRNYGHADGVRADNLWVDLNHALALRLQQNYLIAAYRAMLTAAPDPLGEDDG